MSFQRPLSRFLHEAGEVAPFRGETVNRYTSDPAFRAALDAETAANRARANAAIDVGARRGHPWVDGGAA